MSYSKELLDAIQHKNLSEADLSSCGYCGMDLKDPKHDPKQCEKEAYECLVELQNECLVVKETKKNWCDRCGARFYLLEDQYKHDCPRRPGHLNPPEPPERSS